MTSTNEETTILKTDTRGRVRVPVERREELLKEFDRSGISAMKFARLAGSNMRRLPTGWPNVVGSVAARRRMVAPREAQTQRAVRYGSLKRWRSPSGDLRSGARA